MSVDADMQSAEARQLHSHLSKHQCRIHGQRCMQGHRLVVVVSCVCRSGSAQTLLEYIIRHAAFAKLNAFSHLPGVQLHSTWQSQLFPDCWFPLFVAHSAMKV